MNCQVCALIERAEQRWLKAKRDPSVNQKEVDALESHAGRLACIAYNHSHQCENTQG